MSIAENQTYPSSRKRIPLICIIPKRQNKVPVVLCPWWWLCEEISLDEEFGTRLVVDSSVALFQ